MSQFLVDPSDLSPEDGRAILKGAEAHHLLRVFRARIGDRVDLFDAAGHRWRGRLLDVDGPSAVIGELQPLATGEAPVELVLLQSLLKGERWDWLIAKATELGAAAVVPVRSRRTVSAPKGDRTDARLSRWTSIALAAAKQCERAKIPAVAEPRDLPGVLRELGTPVSGQLRLVFAERRTGGALPRRELVRRVYLAVGPEGGWEPEELDACRDAGFIEMNLGPRVLRSETAGLAALVLAQALWGDLVPVADPW